MSKSLTKTTPAPVSFHDKLAALRAGTMQPHVDQLEQARANFEAKIVAAVSQRVDMTLDAILAF